jgi:hypothetical protein
MMVGHRFPQLGAVENDTWPSTGALETETQSLWLSMLQLSKDVFNSNAYVDDVWTRSWNTFVADVQQWKDAGWFWNPTRRDELLEYRRRFNTLLAQFQGAGVSTGAEQQAATGSTPLDTVNTILTKALWVVGGVGALWAVHSVYKEFRR